MKTTSRAHRWTGLLFLVGWFVGAVAEGGPDTLGEGFPVDRIELRVDAPPARDVDLAEALEIRVGERATRESVRRTLRNLFATGVVEGADILAREEADGSTTAVIAVRTHTWVERVEIVGDPGRPKGELMRLLPQKARTPLFEDRVVRGVFALQDELERHAYLGARVRLEVEPLDRKAAGGQELRTRTVPRRVVVRYRVEAGPPAIVDRIRFEGSRGPWDAADLVQHLASREQRPFSRRRTSHDPEKLREWLVRRGHLVAQVDPPVLETTEGGDHELVIPLDVGPRLRVEVTGVEVRKLRPALPVLRGEPWDLTQISRTARNVKTLLQEMGYWNARVDIALEEDEESGDEAVLRVQVERGESFKITEVQIEGLRLVSAADLVARMTTAPASAVLPGSGRLVDEVLEADIANLRSYLALEGFFEAQIGPPRVEPVDDNGLRITIPIVEGRRRRVVAVNVEGVTSLDLATVRATLPLQPGGPYHPILVDDTVNTLRALYESRGYPLVAIAPRIEPSQDDTLVDVSFRVEEGPQRTVDRVLLRGHQRTHEEVLRRVVPLRTDQPISRLDLLEAERELYRLGVFSQVDIDVLPSTELDEHRDIVVRLDEGQRFRLGYGVSYHSEDGIGGVLSASVANLRGRADQLQLDVRASGSDRRSRIAYSKPHLGRFPIPITFSIYRQEDERNSFAIDDLGLQVAVRRGRGHQFRMGLVADYHVVDLSEEPTDPLDLEPEEREVEIASLTATFLVDRRDDPVDARRGWSTTLQLQQAVPFYRAEASFLEAFLQQTAILPLGRLGRLVGSLRLGAIEPLDDTLERDPVVPAGLESGLIPISERFFAGGRTTHRAYERDRLGILGSTLIERGSERVAIGGNGLALFNLDWRFPVTGDFGGTVFVDAGNVWPSWHDVRPDEVELGVGIGARYRSPVGPVRFEIGWKVDALPGDQNPVFLLSFGNPF